MRLAEGISKHGFRKWYERELLQSHAHLLLTFLCMFGLFAGFEALRDNPSWTDQAIDIVVIALCCGIGVWALRRYLYLLSHAEASAHQADCPQCKVYGRFKLVSEDRAKSKLAVRCNKCEHRWTIDE